MGTVDTIVSNLFTENFRSIGNEKIDWSRARRKKKIEPCGLAGGKTRASNIHNTASHDSR